MRVIAAERLFTGEAMLDEHAVLIEDGRVVDIVPADSVTAERLPDDIILAPGFIDVQVNGGGGVLFNDTPDLPTLRRIVQAHRRFGTTALLPTLITDTPEKLHAACATVAAALASGEPGVAGLHLEGPFISPAKRGVHRAEFIRKMTQADITYLCTQTPRPLLLTLAPELVSTITIRRLADAGIRVSVGHTDATHMQTREAVLAGAHGFTHLYNAMRSPLAREPGPVGAALDHSRTYAGIIADGHHVHPANLRIALRALTPQRTMLVTDAMASIGTALSSFMLQGERIDVADGRLTNADGTLAGAHLDMASAVRNAAAMLGAGLRGALRMASATPADFLGIGETRGRLLPGRMADMVALTDNVDICGVWVAGVPAGVAPLAGPDAAC
jgi:N-acetylglucosamine-6-phosphate deacetylase